MIKSSRENATEVTGATPSIFRKLLSGSVLRTISFLVAAIVSFLMMPFVVRSLGDRMYGFWALVGTFLGYYGLLDFGLSSAVSRHIAGSIGVGDKEECNRIFNTAFFLYLGLGIIILLITVVLACSASLICKTQEDASLFWKVMLILGVNIAINFPIKALRGILTAQLRFDIMSLLELGTLGVRSILIILFLLSGYGILAMAWVTFLSTLPEIGLIVYFSKKNLPSLRIGRNYVTRGASKTLFSYSIFAFIAQVADHLRFNIDAFVIAGFIGLSAVTHYNVASQLTRYFISLMISVVGIFQPLFSQQHGAGDHEGMKKTFLFASKLSVYIASFVSFGLIAWGRPFIERWMGKEYLDAYPCLVILILGSTFALWQLPSVNLLYGTSKHRFYALFNSVEGVCNLLLSLLLVGRFGIVGVAMGTFIPMAIIKLVIQPIYVCKVLSINYLDYIFKMGRAILVVLLSLFFPIMISFKYAIPDYRILFLSGLILLFCYAFLIWFLGFDMMERKRLSYLIFPNRSIKYTN